MGKYRKILAAVDGSESGRNAFRQACKIVRDNKTWMTVFTAVPIYQDQFEVLSTKEKVGKALRDEAEKILSEIKDLAQKEDVYITVKLEEGNPSDTVIDIAEEGNYDLIVMGRRGKKNLEKSLVGSVTARVIGGTQRDVLVVPHNGILGWDNILIATDGSKYSKAATEKAVDLAKSYNGRLKIISAVDVTDEFQTEAPAAVEEMVRHARKIVEGIKEKAVKEGLDTETFVREGESFKVITDLAKTFNSEIIVMGSHGRTGFRRLLMGSVTEKVIGYAPCPVLVTKG